MMIEMMIIMVIKKIAIIVTMINSHFKQEIFFFVLPLRIVT